MPITIGANIASLGVLRQLGKSSDALGRVYERLSTGQRINRASDDAAGLAVSQSLNGDTRVYSQALRNANDAISALSIAGEALQSLSTIVTRQKELAEQAANGVYSFAQRKALNTEANALVDEFNRIAATTKFNNLSLFGSSINVQVGSGSGSTITLDVASSALRTHGDGTFAAYSNLATTGDAQGIIVTDFNGDGKNDLAVGSVTNPAVVVFMGNGDGSFTAPTTITAGGNSSQFILVADVNNDSKSDLVFRSTSISTIGVALGNGDGTFRARIDSSITPTGTFALADFNRDGNIDIVSGHSSTTGVGIAFGQGNGSFSSPTTLAAGITGQTFIATDFNMDGISDFSTTMGSDTAIFIGNGNGTFRVATTLTGEGSDYSLADVNGDGYIDFVRANTNSYRVRLANGDGTFQAARSYALGFTIDEAYVRDINGDGKGDLITFDDDVSGGQRVSIHLGNGDGTFGAPSSYAAPDQLSGQQIGFADVTGDGVSDLLIPQRSGSPGVAIYAANTTRDLSQAYLNLYTADDARDSLDELTTTADRISQGLASIGASLSRLETTTNVLASTRENYAQAAARITDADVAFEAANLIRLQILQRSSTALLAQVNQQPALALQLLK